MFNKKFKVFLIILLFIIQFSIFNTNLSTKSSTTSLNTSNSINLDTIHTLDTNIILINYDNNQNFLNGILSSLPQTLSVQNGPESISYTMQYHLIFPNQTFLNDFDFFISGVSNSNSSTVDINQTALEYQATHNAVQNIFINKNGTAINGTAVENWLWENGQSFRPAGISYQIYLLNLTYLSNRYWFNIPELDPVTHQQRHEWRLEWDYPPFGSINNFNVKFPYPGYGDKYPMYFLDPSAFNWYLNWTRIWRNVPNDQTHREYQNSFTGYLEKIGGFANNQALAGSYIGDWLHELVRDLFVINPLNQIKNHNSLKLQVAVITDESSSNPYPDLHWIINNSIVKNQLHSLVPNANITITENFFNISDHPNVSNLLQNYKMTVSPPPIANYTYYNGNDLFYPIQSLDKEFFGSSKADLTAYILILNNASFAGAGWAGGGLFTGLGGGGRLLILNEVDRLFYNRTTNPVPKESLSKVLIHEAGHGLGLPHPFIESTSNYASDFVGDVMGYYSSTANYSCFMINNFQRLSLEPTIKTVVSNLQFLINTSLSTSYSQQLIEIYKLFLASYKELNFQDAKIYLDNLQTLLKEKIVLEPNGPQAPYFVFSPTGRSVNVDTHVTFMWQIYDLNPYNYSIYVNNSLKGSGLWNTSFFINYNFQANQLGTFNITITVYDRFYLSATKTFILQVIKPVSTSSSTTHQLSLDSLSFILVPVSLISLYASLKKKKIKR